MIDLVTEDLPVAEQRAGQLLKVQRVPPEIELSAVEGPANSPTLKIRVRRPEPGHIVDPKCFMNDAKQIHAWMIWYLPHGTMNALRTLILSQEIK